MTRRRVMLAAAVLAVGYGVLVLGGGIHRGDRRG